MEKKTVLVELGRGEDFPKVSIPKIWIRRLGIGLNNRDVNISFDGDRIIIDKFDRPIKKADLADNTKINGFANKWLDKFKSSDFLWAEFEENFGEDCFSMGFMMDCGNSLSLEYPEAFQFPETNPFRSTVNLKRLINRIDDIELLGAAIFSHYRSETHWSMTPLADIDIEWFIIALDRLAKITE